MLMMSCATALRKLEAAYKIDGNHKHGYQYSHREQCVQDDLKITLGLNIVQAINEMHTKG